MEPATDKPSCRSHVLAIGLFTAGVVLLGLIFSALVKPWIDLSWWQVFRRCVSIAAAVCLWVIVTRLERRSLRSYGFANRTRGVREILLGVGLGVCGLATLVASGLATGMCRIDITPDHARLWMIILGFVPAALLIGVLEELVFRGFLLQHLMACSKPLGLLISTTAYSLVHWKTAPLGVSTGLELGGLFLLGGVLALSYLRTNQLYLAVGLHATLAYGARVNKLLIIFPHESLSWLSGTSRLVNGVLEWVVLLGIGLIIARWIQPSHQGGVYYGKA